MTLLITHQVSHVSEPVSYTNTQQ